MLDATPHEVFERIVAKVARLGWHIIVHFAWQDLGEAAPLVLAGTDQAFHIGLHDQLQDGLGHSAQEVAAILLCDEL